MRLFCLQHFRPEEPGLILQWALDRQIEAHTVHLFAGDDLPAITPNDLVVVMGGPMNVDETEKHPWLLPERNFLRAHADAGGKIFGVCLGSQLIARALGAVVRRNPVKEIGWLPVEIIDSGEAAGIFSGLPASVRVLHWHGDTWDLPEGATLVASSEQCLNQAFVAGEGRLVGLQFHLEAEPHLVRAFVDCFADELAEGGPYVQEGKAITGEMDSYLPSCKTMLYTLLDRWATGTNDTVQAVSEGANAGSPKS